MPEPADNLIRRYRELSGDFAQTLHGSTSQAVRLAREGYQVDRFRSDLLLALGYKRVERGNGIVGYLPPCEEAPGA